jgi:hypothetical protein
MLKIFNIIVLPLAFAATSAVAQDAAPLPDPMPAPTGEPTPPPPKPEMPMPTPEPSPDPAPAPTAPPTEPPPPPTAQAEPVAMPPATLARDYPRCSATIQDSCINPSEAPATKTKNRRRPNRG